MGINIRVRNGMEPDEYGGGVSEGDLRGNSSDIFVGAGVVDVDGGHCLVHEAPSPDMTVIVDPGVVYIPNSSFDDTDSDSIKFWEGVVAGNDASRTLTIDSNSAGSTRIDLACAMINPATTPDTEASNIADLIIVKGTAGAGAPALPDYHVLLATITVANGETAIDDTLIADDRTQVLIREELLPPPVTNTNKCLLFGNDNGAISAGNTLYMFVGGTVQGVSVTESARQTVFPAGSLVKMLINITGNTLNGNAVFTVRKNGANTALLKTVSSGATGVQSAEISASVADGDLLSIEVKTTGATTGSISFQAPVVVYDVT